jgi:hypothetical protein
MIFFNTMARMWWSVTDVSEGVRRVELSRSVTFMPWLGSPICVAFFFHDSVIMGVFYESNDNFVFFVLCPYSFMATTNPFAEGRFDKGL